MDFRKFSVGGVSYGLVSARFLLYPLLLCSPSNSARAVAFFDPEARTSGKFLASPANTGHRNPRDRHGEPVRTPLSDFLLQPNCGRRAEALKHSAALGKKFARRAKYHPHPRVLLRPQGITEIGRAAMVVEGEKVPEDVLTAEEKAKDHAAPHVNFYDPSVYKVEGGRGAVERGYARPGRGRERKTAGGGAHRAEEYRGAPVRCAIEPAC